MSEASLSFGQVGMKDLPLRLGFGINVRGEFRVPRVTEAVALPEKIFQQAEAFGTKFLQVIDTYKQAVQNSDFRQRVGISQQIFHDRIQPFLEVKNPIVYFGADGVIDQGGNLKIIEVNPQPQVLGRYDVTSAQVLGEGDPNSRMSPAIAENLTALLKPGEECVVVTHPGNAFHQYHKLFAEQIGRPVASLQELRADSSGVVEYQGRTVGVIFRQFSMNTLLDSEVTDPKILQAITMGGVIVANGPIAPYLGDKALLPELPSLVQGIETFFPKMVSVVANPDFDINDYKDWWLKGETRGSLEMTMQLSKDNRTGWVGDVVKKILSGDLSGAKLILGDRHNQTADRLRGYTEDIQKSGSNRYLLQENIIPRRINIGSDEGDKDLRTLLRAYFIPGRDGLPPKTFIELFASNNARVSMAGYSIPVTKKY